jgi:thiamine kinase-like enzyme
MELINIFNQFVLDSSKYEINKFGNGLIHGTYLVAKNHEPAYILQEINTAVFKSPETIASNLEKLADFLDSQSEDVFFPLAQKSIAGSPYVVENGVYYRLTPFVADTHSIDACSSPEEAYEASFQFGKFTAAFEKFDANTLDATIPQFHDLKFRWQQFNHALQHGNKDRMYFAQQEINQLKNDFAVVEKFISIQQSDSFLKRVTHHDTKINNVLFNKKGMGVCVIDLDTVMPGYFISDLGDMFRTYLSSANEEETDFDKINARPAFYKALVEGYLDNMQDQMTEDEIAQIPYAGEFMIYMQALRFLTDFLNNDSYYGISYELNNYNRAKNQLTLLNQFRRISK